MKSPARTLRVVADVACNTGEGPLWHPDLQTLFWVDIPEGKLYAYNPAKDTHRLVYDDRPIGGFTLQDDGQLLLFRDRGNVVTLDPSGGDITGVVIEEIGDEIDTRFNDVFAHPLGGVFCGTMPSKAQGRKGRLYHLSAAGELTQLLDDVGCSNGMGLSIDGKTLYYIDTPTQRVDQFDFNPQTAEISNRRALLETNELSGSPDGMTVDRRGHLYVGFWGGACVREFDPHGGLVETYAVPSRNVTSLCLAPCGPGLDPEAVVSDGVATSWGYITTATGGQPRDEAHPQAGSLFAMRMPAPGREEFRSRLKANRLERH